MIIHLFTKVWEGLVKPAYSGNKREYHLSRTLNIILLLLLAWGIGFEIQSKLSHKFLNSGDIFVFVMLGILLLAYALNRRGQFQAATILTLGLFITSTFVFAVMQHLSGSGNFSVLYYLIIAILMSELFFSMQGYLTTVTIMM